MHRRTVFDPRTKRWEASLYKLGDRPSDGKLVPLLTAVGPTLSTEGQVRVRSVFFHYRKEKRGDALRQEGSN